MPPRRGRTGKRWLRLRQEVKGRGRPCCRCGQPIDLSLKYPDPGSFSVDHYPYPLSTHPQLAEDPANLAGAHLSCNASAQDGRRPAKGPSSENW